MIGQKVHTSRVTDWQGRERFISCIPYIPKGISFPKQKSHLMFFFFFYKKNFFPNLFFSIIWMFRALQKNKNDVVLVPLKLYSRVPPWAWRVPEWRRFISYFYTSCTNLLTSHNVFFFHNGSFPMRRKKEEEKSYLWKFCATRGFRLWENKKPHFLFRKKKIMRGKKNRKMQKF